MRTRKNDRVVHVGQTGSYERTDPDYNDKRLAKLAQDYRSCPAQWQVTFIDGLTNADVRALQERGVL